MKPFRSPALQMALLGSLLFAAWGFLAKALVSPDDDRPALIIPKHRIDISTDQFVQETGRRPSPSETRALIDQLIDQEVLYRYAIELGAHEEPVARRRLAQIASFVEDNPHGHQTEAQLASQAVRLGLHEGDLVVRRILSDAARRLIRAVVLVREPAEQDLEAYRRSHEAQFARPAVVSLTHVSVNGLKHGAETENHAVRLLDQIRRGGIAPEAAVALGDEPFVPSSLVDVSEPGLEMRFGYKFAQIADSAPTGRWIGPVPSRYGYHLLYVHERRPPYVPELAEIRDQVHQSLLQDLADEWLELRLRELRAGYRVVVPEVAT